MIDLGYSLLRQLFSEPCTDYLEELGRGVEKMFKGANCASLNEIYFW